jgi:5-formyltetrahydrofolate cyclo-ligase
MAAPHSSAADEAALDAAKASARARAKQLRAACDPALGERLAVHLLAHDPPGEVVAGFWPLPGEIDLRPVLHALHERGRTVVLPVTPARGQKLAFRVWTPGAPMEPGRFGTSHPAGPEAIPTVVLVPFLAFDRAGRRLGYGGGYYDRTLARLPGVRTIGCGFSALELDEVPAGPYDATLDAVATELGVTLCRRQA